MSLFSFTAEEFEITTKTVALMLAEMQKETPSRELSLAITKFEEMLLWLGQYVEKQKLLESDK